MPYKPKGFWEIRHDVITSRLYVIDNKMAHHLSCVFDIRF